MDLMQTITEESLRAHFGYLFTDYGFSIKDNIYDEKNFGNAVIVLVSRDLNLRIIRDRGQLFLDIGSPMDEGVWFDLNDVLAVINRGSGEALGEGVIFYEVGKAEDKFMGTPNLLQGNMPRIIKSFQMPEYEETKQKLIDYASQRVERLLGKTENTGLQELEGNTIVEDIYSLGIDNLIKQLLIPETVRIYRFSDNGAIGIWVVVKKVDIDLEMKYSGLFFSVLANFPLLRCDFMVYDENELRRAPLPVDATIVYDREGS